jgi:hypothetical protein
MARKFTFDQVKQVFRAANFKLLSSCYKSSKEQLAYRCKSCGHEGVTKLEYVKAGSGCPRCWEARRGQSSKHSFDYIREKFSVRKLLLLEKNYPNSKTPLHYKCVECGYKGQLRFNDLSNGSGCRQCGVVRRSSRQKLDFETFKNEMCKREIEVLSQEYVNSGTKLRLRCIKCRRLWKARAHDLRQTDGGCPRCGHNRGGQKRAYTHDQIVQELAKQRIVLLSTYRSSQKSIRVRFEQCGHTVWRTWNTIQCGIGCPKCAPNARPTHKDYRLLAAKFEGQVLEIARTSNLQSKWRCSIGHIFRRPFISIKELGTFCTICSGSYAEMLCRVAIEKLFKKSFPRKRVSGMKSPKGRLLELDIYNQELKLAVEHHGIHHYRALPHWSGIEGLHRQRLHDDLRRKFCKANDILLIEIRELGIRTSLEEMRQQVRNALLQDGRNIPSSFDAADLTNLPQLNASQIYWAETQEAAKKIGLKILSKVFQGSEMPVIVRCKQGHVTPKTTRSILQGHQCDECNMEQRKKPLRLSDGRMFESGTAAAKILGVRKETVNTAIRNQWKVKGLGIKRITLDEFRQSLISA